MKSSNERDEKKGQRMETVVQINPGEIQQYVDQFYNRDFVEHLGRVDSIKIKEETWKHGHRFRQSTLERRSTVFQDFTIVGEALFFCQSG